MCQNNVHKIYMENTCNLHVALPWNTRAYFRILFTPCDQSLKGLLGLLQLMAYPKDWTWILVGVGCSAALTCRFRGLSAAASSSLTCVCTSTCHTFCALGIAAVSYSSMLSARTNRCKQWGGCSCYPIITALSHRWSEDMPTIFTAGITFMMNDVKWRSMRGMNKARQKPYPHPLNMKL